MPRSAGSRLARIAGFTLVLSLVAVAIPILALLGLRAALGNDGSPVRSGLSSDPNAAGYQAIVSPTPTMLVLGVTADQQLASVALLTSGVSGGSIVLVPTLTLAGPGPRTQPLSDIYRASGRSGVVDAVGSLFHLGFDTVVESDPRWWAAAVNDVAPLVVDNSDDLLDASDASAEPKVIFGAGRLRLQPADVATYLALRNPDEDERAALFRHELLWRAWLDAEARQPVRSPAAGNVGVFQTFLAGLASGPTQIVGLPVTPDEPLIRRTDGELWFKTDPDGLAEFLGAIVPFPASGRPGDRIKVRLLDGRGDRGIALGAAAVLVPKGAEIDLFGNADRFDYRGSVVEYYDAAHREQADLLARAMGATEVTLKAQAQESVDVTIIVGLDFSADSVTR